MGQSGLDHGTGAGAPEECEFVVPEAWRDRVHARRGGIAADVARVDTRAAGAIRCRLAKIQADVDGALDHEQSEKEMAQAARDHLGGEPNPLGAAVLAALIWSLSNWDEEKCESFTDAWAAQHGLLFAARATAELSRVIVQYRAKRPTFDGWVGALDDDSGASGFDDIEGAAHRMRELLAVAGDAEYQEVEAALADHRLTGYQRVVVSYLLPTRADWVDALVATPLKASYARRSPMLVGALGSAGQLSLLRERQGDAWLEIPRLAHTVAEGVGSALGPALVELLDGKQVRDRAALGSVFGVLAAMPGDETFDALATRLGEPGAHAAVQEARERFPVRALRLLASVAWGNSRRARLAKRLLRDHVKARPALVEEISPQLSDRDRKAIGAALRARDWVMEEAAADALPRSLREPTSTGEPDGAGGSRTTGAAEAIDAYLLPQVLLRGRRQALPIAAVRRLVALLTALGTGEAGEADAGIDAVKEACDPASLDEFVWALFQQAGEAAWALAALERLGGDETARGLTALIRTWPKRGYHRKAIAGIDVLVAIGNDVALMYLIGTARKTTHDSVKSAARDRIERLAAARGLSAEQFTEQAVPDFGLERDGSLTLDYGHRRFTAAFDERLRPYVRDEAGKRRKGVPRPGVRDDQVLAPLAHRQFTGLKKDVRVVAADQIRRLERAMVTERRWTLAEFRACFADHPLLWHIARRLVWTAEDAGVCRAFRLAEDRTLADADDDTLTLPESATVAVAHPVHLTDVEVWAEVFADYEILQPFRQLERPVHTLADDERDSTDLKRFLDIAVPTGKVLGLEQHGWRRAAPQDGGVQPWISREMPGGQFVVVGLSPGIVVRSPLSCPEQTVVSVLVSDRPDGVRAPDSPLRFGDLGPVSVSELLADLTALTALTETTL
ncbi:DUF4132 domain-containing protein [Streptomyces sp. NPDC097640]|uniref:DUF4132 domain-containing protein n=1 Tax=Streptomyces sp. NPDC097640 TaxID=3157229 RepID=UPI0033212C00